VVVFVGHTLLLRGVGLNVDNVADAVRDEERREFDHAILCTGSSSAPAYVLQIGGTRTLELALEHVARTRAVTEGVRHLED
jgi:hypothetical protein